MNELVGLIGFSFVGAVTPGPNNVLLWASGVEFGFRRTLRHVIGSALGIGAMALATAGGMGALVTAVPEVGLAMRVGGSVYLLYLAYRSPVPAPSSGARRHGRWDWSRRPPSS